MDIKHFFLCVSCFLLVACQSANVAQRSNFEQSTNTDILTPEKTRSNEFASLARQHLMDEKFAAIEVSDSNIFTLSAEQKQRFDAFYHNPRYAHLSAPDRFSEFLTTRLAGFTYHGETYSASETFEKMSGNCMSLAILTTALAQYAELDIRYQQVNSPPVYEKHGNIILLSSHVRTRVYGPSKPRKEGIITLRPFVTIDYFPVAGDVRSELVSHDRFLVMYHHNVVANALIDENYDLSYAHVKRALTYQSEHAETFNLLALIYKRMGYVLAAKNLYSDLLAIDSSSLNAIENYVSLLKQAREFELANVYLPAIEDANERNPYQWLSLAERHLREGELRLAKKYAQRSVDLAPYLHEPHFLLAKIHYQGDKYGASRKSLALAKSLAKNSEQQTRYEAKLLALKGR